MAVISDYERLTTYSSSTDLSYEQIRRHEQMMLRRHATRHHCDCFACLRERMYEYRKCGCRECYEEYKYTERMMMTREYRAEHTPQVVYYNNVEPLQFYDGSKKQLSSGEDMNIVEKVKNLKLSAADKLLRKHGIVDSDGNLTGTGEELLQEKLFEAYKDEIVADLKAVEASEKGKK